LIFKNKTNGNKTMDLIDRLLLRNATEFTFWEDPEAYERIVVRLCDKKWRIFNPSGRFLCSSSPELGTERYVWSYSLGQSFSPVVKFNNRNEAINLALCILDGTIKIKD
jgi:hypothetical protein